ncbi:T9SS type A sorting domain-containing protein [Aquimarina algiphila]|uniref:T9SS type A sorting domain-containing protein n=1 Tax=Aquimarina algiphila TaxID=2047982 RepID=UPI00232D1B41|nr:T9SS type A sorting domain-containing protein [Aquimarina algiphila]
MYPNPAGLEASFITKGLDDPTDINIYDIQGKLQYTDQIQNQEMTLNTGSILSSRIYLVVFQNGTYKNSKKLTIK